MRVEITLLVGALGIHYARGHGTQMYNPTPWQATSDCSWAAPGYKRYFCMENPGYYDFDLKVPTNCTGNCHVAVADGKITIGDPAFSTNYTTAPGQKPTIPEEMFDAWLPEWRRKTWTGAGEFRLNPWNAPGSAPVYGNGCGVNGGNPDGCTGGGEDLGQCCGKPGVSWDCGGYSGGKSAVEHYQDGLFGEPQVTTWTRGRNAHVYWTSDAYARGGYAYRLCRVPDGQYWKVTEECFQQGHLNFAGKTSYIYWKPYWNFFHGGWIPVDLITTKIGTTPEGSEWAKINLPNEPSIGDMWAFNDVVKVPKSLTPGDYVLSFRWDCLESPQIYSACANIKIE